MSNTKLALAVLWPAFWTGLPIKLALTLLFLALGMMKLEALFGVAFLLLLSSPVTVLAMPFLIGLFDLHLSEGAGLSLVFLFSIPIDMWAVGLSARTVFIERLQLEPQDGMAVQLWGKIAVVGGACVVALWAVEGFVTGLAKSVAHAVLEMELLKALPVAERISLELTLWGSVSTITLVVLLVLSLWAVGAVIQMQARQSRPLAESYQKLVHRWDLMRVPADQGLILTAFTGAGVVMTLLFWSGLPSTTPHPHETYQQPVAKVAPVLKPVEVLNKSERVLTQAESAVEALEKKKAEESSQSKKASKGKPGPKESSAATATDAPVAKTAVSASPSLKQ